METDACVEYEEDLPALNLIQHNHHLNSDDGFQNDDPNAMDRPEEDPSKEGPGNTEGFDNSWNNWEAVPKYTRVPGPMTQGVAMFG